MQCTRAIDTPSTFETVQCTRAIDTQSTFETVQCTRAIDTPSTFPTTRTPGCPAHQHPREKGNPRNRKCIHTLLGARAKHCCIPKCLCQQELQTLLQQWCHASPASGGARGGTECFRLAHRRYRRTTAFLGAVLAWHTKGGAPAQRHNDTTATSK